MSIECFRGPEEADAQSMRAAVLLDELDYPGATSNMPCTAVIHIGMQLDDPTGNIYESISLHAQVHGSMIHGRAKLLLGYRRGKRLRWSSTAALRESCLYPRPTSMRDGMCVQGFIDASKHGICACF